jgi:hypothetical protein
VLCRILWYPVGVGLPTPFKLGKGVKTYGNVIFFHSVRRSQCCGSLHWQVA